MTIDYGTAFAGLNTAVTSGLTDALPVGTPLFGALVGLSVFINVLGKFGIRR